MYAPHMVNMKIHDDTYMKYLDNNSQLQQHHPTGHSQDIHAYHDLSDEVLHYIENSVSKNTVRSRESDIRAFLRWGGHLPSTPEEVAHFFADQAKVKKFSTIQHYGTSLNHWHGANRYPSPCKTELVRAVVAGIGRTHGRKQKRAKPLLIEDIKQLIDAHQGDQLADYRHRSMLLLGFIGAFRRSELCAINYSDLEFVSEGVQVTLPKSKTNQSGEREIKPIPYAKREVQYCPVNHLKEWLRVSGINQGPVYRRITRKGVLGDHPLTGDGFSKMLKILCQKAQLDTAGISPHSLRAGFITTAYLTGKDRLKTKQISGHRSDEIFEKYIRDADLYRNNAADLF
jgi:integrase